MIEPVVLGRFLTHVRAPDLPAGTRAHNAPAVNRSLHGTLTQSYAEAVAWLHTHWLEIALASIAGVLIYLGLNLLRGWSLKLCRRGGVVASWYSIIGRAIGKTGHIFMILAAARLVVGYSNAPPTLAATIMTLFTISAVFQAAVWVREIVFGAIENRTRDDSHQAAALVSALGIIRLLVTIALFAIAAVVVLGNLGVNVTGLVAGLGVGGIAIGLAAQGIFADLFAALAILFDRPFRVGDTISYDKGSGSGAVEAIGLKSTRIRGGGGEQRILANKKLLDFEILNITRRLHNRFKFDFVLGYATAPDVMLRIPDLLRAAVESEGYILVHGGFNGFAPSGFSYDVEFESKEADFPAAARDRVAAAIIARFREHGITFADPTQVNPSAEKASPAPPVQAGDSTR